MNCLISEHNSINWNHKTIYISNLHFFKIFLLCSQNQPIILHPNSLQSILAFSIHPLLFPHFGFFSKFSSWNFVLVHNLHMRMFNLPIITSFLGLDILLNFLF
jgi:hypothetical protein